MRNLPGETDQLGSETGMIGMTRVETPESRPTDSAPDPLIICDGDETRPRDGSQALRRVPGGCRGYSCCVRGRTETTDALGACMAREEGQTRRGKRIMIENLEQQANEWALFKCFLHKCRSVDLHCLTRNLSCGRIRRAGYSSASLTQREVT